MKLYKGPPPLKKCTVAGEYGEHCVTKDRRPGRVAYLTQPKPCRPSVQCVPWTGSFKAKPCRSRKGRGRGRR